MHLGHVERLGLSDHLLECVARQRATESEEIRFRDRLQGAQSEALRRDRFDPGLHGRAGAHPPRQSSAALTALKIAYIDAAFPAVTIRHRLRSAKGYFCTNVVLR